MNVRFKQHFYQAPEGEGDGGGGAAVIDPPAPSSAPAAAAATASAPAASAPAASPAPAAPAPSPAADPPKPAWPEDWRTLAASGDEKTAKLLERYTTPAEVAKALREVNIRISKGELKAPLKKDATPEELKAWRTEQGIPETPDKYDLTLPDGMVIGDNDKPYVDAYAAALHAENASPSTVKAGIAAFMRARQAQVAKIAENDATHKDEVESTLVEAWGHGDYKRNVASITAMLGQADSTVADVVLNARGPDGRAIANNPAVLKWLAGHARELGFVGGTIPPAGGTNAETIDGEIKRIEATRFNADGSRNPAYWKDDKVQARYRELLDARDRLK